MANKLSFDINMNTAGYVQGARQAQQSTKDLEKSTNKYLKEFGSLRKELSAAKKEAYNLAMEFSQLSKTEKESEIGKQMAEDLNLAIQKAGELQDVLGDTNEAIKNVASDTAGLDGLRDALDIGKSTATAFAGAIAKVTGNDKKLTDVVSNLAIVEGGFNAIIKISNQLQNRATIITSLYKSGIIDLTTATKLQTAAQKASNTVVKASPYILVGLAIAGLIVTMNKYFFTLQQNIDYTKKFKEESHKASIEGRKDAQTELAQVEILYKRTQDLTLSYKERLKAVDDLQKQYPNYFKSLKDEDILAGRASKTYQQLKDDIIAVAQARAYEKKIEQIGEENVELEEQIKEQEKILENARKMRDAAGTGFVSGREGRMMDTGTGAYVEKQIVKLEALKRQQQENIKAQQEYINKINKTTLAQERLNNTPKTSTKATKEQLTYLGKLEKNVSDLKKNLENIDPKAPNFNNLVHDIQVKIAKAEKELKDYKISIGLEVVPVDKSGAEKEKALKNIQDIYDELNKSEQNFDFSGLSDEDRKNAAEILEKYQKLVKARDEFKKVAETTTDSEAQYAAVQAWIETSNAIDGATDSLQRFIELSEKNNAYADYIKKDAEAYGYYAQMVQGVSNALSVLGETEAAQMAQFTANSAALVMDAIKTITAMNAEAIAKGASSAFALPFPANLAAWATVLTTINSIFANLPKFSEGGIVHGKGSIGDFNLVRANDGEAFFNTRQQKRLFDLANGTGYIGNNTLHIIGTTKVNGSDLDIVWTNYNRINKRAR